MSQQPPVDDADHDDDGDAELGALLDDELFAAGGEGEGEEEEEQEQPGAFGTAAVRAEAARAQGAPSPAPPPPPPPSDPQQERDKKRQRVGVGGGGGSPARASAAATAAAAAAAAPSHPAPRLAASTSAPAPAPAMCPPHPAFMCGLCVVCGQPPSDGDPQDNNAAAATAPPPPPHDDDHHHPGLPLPAAAHGHHPDPTASSSSSLALRHLHASRALVVSAEEAQRVAETTGRALLRRKRLTLVLDLDHTLVNTARWGDLTEAERAAAEALLGQQTEAQRAWEEGQEEEGGKDKNKVAEEKEKKSGGGEAEKQDDAKKAPPGPRRRPSRRPPPPQHDVFALAGANFALVTKVRPGARELLRALSPLYELHVYTMGDRSYADLVAGLLDPDGSLLGGGGGGGVAAGGGGGNAASASNNNPATTTTSARVISAGDSSTRGSKDLDVLLVSERRAVVLDDTEAVWSSRARANVVAVPRYHYWGGSARGWDREMGKGLLERGLEQEGLASAKDGALLGGQGKEEGHDDKGDDEERRRLQQQERLCRAARAADEPSDLSDDSAAPMAVALRVLRDVHAAFFRDVVGDDDGNAAADNPPNPVILTKPQVDRLAASGDVRAALREVRGRALAGCRLVFSGLWPTVGCDPCAQPRWRLAESLGADCSAIYVPPPAPNATTHVVAAPPGQTEKAVRAKRDGKAVVVHPDWLAACGFLWSRADERPYLLSSGYAGSRDVGHHHLHGLDPFVRRRGAGSGRGNGGGGGGGGIDDEEERERRAALAAAAGGGGGGGGASGN